MHFLLPFYAPSYEYSFRKYNDMNRSIFSIEGFRFSCVFLVSYDVAYAVRRRKSKFNFAYKVD